MFYFPRLSYGVRAIWFRNFLYFKKSLLVSLLWGTIEPLFYLFAIGYGLGQFVGEIDGVSYFNFYLPGALCNTAMMVSLLEASYGSYYKMEHQKTYASILLSPISERDVVMGEMLWAASKAMLSVVLISLVSLFVVDFSQFVRLIETWPILFLICWMFSCLGMYLVSIAKSMESFTYAISGFAVPMSLFSGAYFPVESLPRWGEILTYFLPLTYGVKLVRGIYQESLIFSDWLGILGILVPGFFIGNIAIARIRRRLLS